MKYESILFNTEMIRAILDGRKTQMRRVVKKGTHLDLTWGIPERRKQYDFLRLPNGDEVNIKSPYGVVGDRLWVRETWAVHICSHEKPSELYQPQRVWYKTDADAGLPDRGPWRPSIFMPRWASRITLEVINVKVERLWEISENDMNKEGVNSPPDENGVHWATPWIKLWDSINKKRGYGWEENPYVWVVDFKPILQ